MQKEEMQPITGAERIEEELRKRQKQSEMFLSSAKLKVQLMVIIPPLP